MKTINYKIDQTKIFKIGDENVSEYLNKPNGIQELLEVSDETINLYYKAALQLLEEKRWEDAADAFLFLILLSPWVHNYWIGAGIADQSQGKFNDAIHYYTMAELTDPKDPILHANSFQCHVALKEMEAAKNSLLQALECCGDQPEHAELKAKLDACKNRL